MNVTRRSDADQSSENNDRHGGSRGPDRSGREYGLATGKSLRVGGDSQPSGYTPENHALIQLQRDRGNRATQRVVKERHQPNLKIGPPNSRYEREADDVARSVVQTPDDGCCLSCAGGKKCENTTDVRRKAERGGTEERVPAELTPRIQNLRDRGELLPGQIRTNMEPRLEQDFSEVRIHRDVEAARTAEALDARAYTIGNHIVFNSGQYAPGTTSGDYLIAHELAHVAQLDPEERVHRFSASDILPSIRGVGLFGLGGGALGVPGLGRGSFGVPGLGGGPLGIDMHKAIECAAIQGRSVWTIVSGEDLSVSTLLGIEEPQEGGPGTFRTVMGIIDHPCLAMLPGYGILRSQISDEQVQEIASIIDIAWVALRNPDVLIAGLRDALAPRLQEAGTAARDAIRSVVSSEHIEGVMRHLEPKLDYLYENWWQVLKDTGWDLLWPWPGVADDFAKIWAHTKSMASNIWDLEFSDALDDFLAITRLLAAAAGRLYGWFAIAAILIGGILGAIGGSAVGPAGTGGGFVAGMAGGLQLAATVGYGLLIATIAAESLSILKASYNLEQEDRSAEEKECDYEVISSSAVVIGISVAFMFLGSVAAKMGKAVIQAIGRRTWRLPARRPAGRRSTRRRRMEEREGIEEPGPRRESRGDVLEARFSLAEYVRSVFSRRQVKVSDTMSTADNFPGIDLADGRVQIRSQTTGRVLRDLNAFDDAIAAGEQVEITIDGGNIWQVKSRGRMPTDRIVNNTRSDIRATSRFQSGTISRKHQVIVQNPAERILVVFLEEGLPAAEVANLHSYAAQNGIRLILTTEPFPPGHPAVVPFESLPSIAGELASGAGRTAGENEPGEGIEGEPRGVPAGEPREVTCDPRESPP